MQNTLLIPVMSPVDSDVKFAPQLGSRLSQSGYEITYIPKNESIADKLTCEIQTQVNQPYSHHTPSSPLSELLCKYGIESVRNFVFTQMSYDVEYPYPNRTFRIPLKKAPYEQYKKKLHRALDYLDNLFSSNGGGVPIQNQGGEIFRRSLQKVADYHDIPSIWIAFSPIPNHSRLRKGEYTSWDFNDVDYEALSENDRLQAKEYIQRIRSEQPLIGVQKDDLRSNIERKISRMIDEGTNIFPVAINWLKNRIYEKSYERLITELYNNICESESIIDKNEYIFYPLQYYRESRVTVRAPAFYDQSWLIEYLSRSLPTGYFLIVKPHPNHITAQSFLDAIEMTEYANVVSPQISTNKLIEGADAVVVLNNTVGYEALIYQKPVITLGDAFYGDCKFTHSPSNINKLSASLTTAINSGGLSEQEVLAFVHSVFEGSSKGEWGKRSDENIERLAESIETKLHEDPN